MWRQNEDRLHLCREGDTSPFGYITVPSTTATLSVVRDLIVSEVGASPASFLFLLPGSSTPVSRVQEQKVKITEFFPTAVIRELQSEHKRKKVAVIFSGERFTAWTTPTYTFAQLRRDAANFWNFNADNVALFDESGTSYPDQALLSTSGFLGSSSGIPVVLLCPKPPRGSSLTAPTLGRPRSPLGPSLGVAARSQPKLSPLSDSIVVTTGTHTSIKRASSQERNHQGYFASLWYIFTSYCVQGDALQPTFLDKRQWARLLRDCGLLKAEFTLATAHLVYTAACSSKFSGLTRLRTHWGEKSGRMGYEQFLDALVDVAGRVYPGIAESTEAIDSVTKPEGVDSDLGLINNKEGRTNELSGPVRALVVLLTSQVLPLASRWPIEEWRTMGVELRSPGVCEVLARFVAPLHAIFRFYAPPLRHSNKVDVEADLALTNNDFRRVVKDFSLTGLGLTSAQTSEVFLASAESGGFPLHLLGKDVLALELPGRHPNEFKPSYSLPEHKYRDGSSVWDRPALFFEHWLEAVGRLAVATFASYRRRDNDESLAENCQLDRCPEVVSMIKAFLQHLSKTLSNDRISRIVAHRSNVSTNPAGFLHGTSELGRKFLRMWIEEGRPDFLSGVRLQSPGTNLELSGAADFRDDRCYMSLLDRSSPSRSASSAIHTSSFDSPLSHKQSDTWTVVGAKVALGGWEAIEELAILEHAMGGKSGSATRIALTEASQSSQQIALSAAAGCCGAKGCMLTDTGGAQDSDSGTITASVAVPLAASNGYQDEGGSQCNDIDNPRHQMEHHPESSDPGDSRHGDNITEWCSNSPCFVPPTLPAKNNRIGGKCEAAERTVSEGTSGTHINTEASNVKNELSDDTFTNTNVDTLQCSVNSDTKSVAQRQLLVKGAVFRKHGRYGAPHRRYVWCNEALTKIHWCPLHKRGSGKVKGKTLQIASLISILRGRTTEVFKRSSGGSAADAAEQDPLCLSLLGQGRTLDLEADSKSSRDAWASALESLLPGETSLR